MPDERSGQSVFERTYYRYLNQVSGIIHQLPADRMGILINDNEIDLTLLNRKYNISQNGIVDPSGKRPSFDICVILLMYLLTDRNTGSR